MVTGTIGGQSYQYYLSQRSNLESQRADAAANSRATEGYDAELERVRLRISAFDRAQRTGEDPQVALQALKRKDAASEYARLPAREQAIYNEQKSQVRSERQIRDSGLQGAQQANFLALAQRTGGNRQAFLRDPNTRVERTTGGFTATRDVPAATPVSASAGANFSNVSGAQERYEYTVTPAEKKAFPPILGAIGFNDASADASFSNPVVVSLQGAAVRAQEKGLQRTPGFADQFGRDARQFSGSVGGFLSSGLERVGRARESPREAASLAFDVATFSPLKSTARYVGGETPAFLLAGPTVGRRDESSAGAVIFGGVRPVFGATGVALEKSEGPVSRAGVFLEGAGGGRPFGATTTGQGLQVVGPMLGGLGEQLRRRPEDTARDAAVGYASGFGIGRLAGVYVTRTASASALAASRRGYSAEKALGIGLKSGRATEVAVGGTGLGLAGVSFGLQTPRERGASLPSFVSGFAGASAGYRSGVPRPSVNIRQTGKSRYDVDVFGSGLSTQAGGIRTTPFEATIQGYGLSGKVPITEVSTLEIGGAPKGTKIGFRSTSITQVPSGTPLSGRVPTARTYRGRFDIVSGNVEFAGPQGLSGRLGVVDRSFTGRFTGQRFKTFATSDTFVGGRPSESRLATGQLSTRDISGRGIRVTGFENPSVSSGTARGKAPRLRGPPQYKSSLGFDVVGGRSGEAFFDRAGESRFDRVGTTESITVERPPIAQTRFDPRAGIRDTTSPRTVVPSYGIPQVNLASSSVPFGFGKSGSGARSRVEAGSLGFTGALSLPNTGARLTYLGGTRSSSLTDGLSEAGGSSISLTDFDTTTTSTPGFTPTSTPGIPSITTPPGGPPVPGLPGLPGLPLFSVGSFGTEGRGTSRSFKYAPSLGSYLYNVRGRKPKGPLGGLEIRPIESGRRKKRRRG